MMLILERRPGSSIRIGDDITVTVKQVRRNNSVKLAIRAPRDVAVLRDELIRSDYEQSLAQARPSLAEPTTVTERSGDDRFEILVIEDEPAHAKLIETALTGGGYTDLTWCDRGSSALELLDQSGPDAGVSPRLVLLDYHLPDITGLDVIRRVRDSERGAGLPIVMLSSVAEDKYVHECLDAGANAFVEKAQRFEEFEESVRTIANYWARLRKVS